jgi:hypothetical protein
MGIAHQLNSDIYQIMTYLDAAYRILQHAGEPLHYHEITRRVLAQGLIQPAGLLLFGQHYPVTTWREVYLKTIDVLDQRHPDEFAQKATTLRGRKCQYIAPRLKG